MSCSDGSARRSAGPFAAERMHLDLGAEDGSGSVPARTEAALERAIHAINQERGADLPTEQHKGTILVGIRDAIEESARRQEEIPKKKRLTFHGVKNATPGDAEQELSTCLDGIRPESCTLALKPSACIIPDLVCAGVVGCYGEMCVEI